MKKSVICYHEIYTALGPNLQETWDRLLECKTAVKPVKRFSCNDIDHKFAATDSRLDDMNHKEQLLFLIEKLTTPIKDKIPKDTVVIWTGAKNNTSALAENDVELKASFFRKAIEKALDLDSEGFEINAACASSNIAVAIASQMIKQNDGKSYLIVSADTVSAFTHWGFASLKALTMSEAKPFDLNRDGLALGDGAVIMHICEEEYANELGLKKSLRVKGWGMANDANHITGPARDGCGLIQSIEKACNEANIDNSKIKAFFSHGTSTRFNDTMELIAANSFFKNSPPPTFSVKGAIGHSLGSAGGIEVALASKIFEEKIIPGTVGLETPEEIGKSFLIKKPTKFEGELILTTNSGFGGVNGALILEAVK